MSHQGLHITPTLSLSCFRFLICYLQPPHRSPLSFLYHSTCSGKGRPATQSMPTTPKKDPTPSPTPTPLMKNTYFVRMDFFFFFCICTAVKKFLVPFLLSPPSVAPLLPLSPDPRITYPPLRLLTAQNLCWVLSVLSYRISCLSLSPCNYP